MNPQDACQPTSASPGKTGASMAPPVLQVQGLCAWYGPAQVLHAVDLCVQAGEVVCLLGRNGAGKSTTFKALVGWVTHSVQCLRLAGQEVSGWRTDARARAGLGFVPEDRRIFTELTVLENLRVAAQGHAHTDAPWGVDEVFALFPHLADLRNRLGAHMSGGEQQMLSVARSLMGQPRVLLLDEPSEGVAPVVVEQMAQAIGQLKARGVSVLLSEQNWRFAQRVCDRTYVLEKGQVVFAGGWQAAQADPAAQRALWEL